MAINTHQADHVEYIQDSNGNKHYLNAEYLDGHSYGEISNAIGGKGTVTSVATADGITGGPITTSGTIKANLKSYTKNTAEIGGRLYGVELDKNGKLAVNVPWTDTNTDTKVTSAANHYPPVADSSAQLSVDASSTTAATWNSTSLVTGVNLQRDAKGHVTGVTVDSIKMPANPNTDTHYVARLYAGLKDTKANGAAGNGYTYLKLVENDTIRDQHNIVGSGATVVTSDANGKITIDTDTSSLVPYDGATRDVNLVNHALFISDTTGADNTAIKVSGKRISEDDTSITIDPINIKLTGTRRLKATLAASGLQITDDTTCTAFVNPHGF